MNDNKITVIDSIMGAGKTSWAIQYMDTKPKDNFLYITPFLSEVKRIINTTKRKFGEPLNKGKGKIKSLNEMLACQMDIVATHELFRNIDVQGRENIKNGNYTLILDEVLNVVEPYNNVYKDDIKLLQEGGFVSIDNDGFVIWNKDKIEYDTKYNEIKLLADNRSLVCVNQKLLLWRYPPDIFRLFEKIYILTYLFEASVLKSYFDLYNLTYTKKSICKDSKGYQIVDYFIPNTSVYKDMIKVYDGKLNNNFPQKRTGLSATWFRAKINRDNMKQLKKNIYNYFSNIIKAKSDTIMWTTYKECISRLKGKGYTNSFIPCNCRSTNEYVTKTNLAYCINVYLHPAVSQFFKQHGVYINEDLYALSELLQWIWRSGIRDDKHINIYIPSNRMRTLLYNWMDENLNFRK